MSRSASPPPCSAAYSVDPVAVGRAVEVTADLDRVRVSWAGRVVADHSRCWARHQSLTDPAHVRAAAVMRAAHHDRRPLVEDQVERRQLSDYDTVFGLDETGVAAGERVA